MIKYFQEINEATGTGNWTGYTEVNGDTIDKSEDAAFPYRGRYGLRVVCVEGGSAAYAYKEGLDISVPPGGSIVLQFLLNFADNPSDTTYVATYYTSGGTHLCHCDVRSSGKLRIGAGGDGGWTTKESSTICTGKQLWVGWEMKRATTSTASDGLARIYIDGIVDAERTGIDNYDTFTDIDLLRVGIPAYSRAGFVVDFDEVVLANEPVKPPLPAGTVWK